MKTFKVNNFITLKLEGEKIIIYINGKRYDQCKALVLNIPVKEMVGLGELESIDQAADTLKRASKETVYTEIHLPPEIEFWGHCSNLQVWAEHDYDTHLLHSNLAFNLLRELGEAGDLKAKRVFKEEIAKRFNEGYPPVNEFLVNSGLLNVLDKEEFLSLLDIEESTAIIDLEKILGKDLELLPAESRHYISGFWLEGRHITGLKLEGERLKWLPDSIGNLVHIKWLFLLENKFETLPDSIGGCRSLELLDLRDNRLHSIPESLGNLNRLKRLMLDGNCLTTLPETLKNIKSLQKLTFYGNNLKTIPNFIKEMKRIGIKIFH